VRAKPRCPTRESARCIGLAFVMSLRLGAMLPVGLAIAACAGAPPPTIDTTSTPQPTQTPLVTISPAPSLTPSIRPTAAEVPSPHAAASEDQAVISALNAASLSPWWSMPAEYQITRAEWSRDETLLAIDSPKGIQLWAFPGLRYIGTINASSSDFAFIEGPGGPMLLVGDWGSVVVWDPILQAPGGEYRDRRDVSNPASLGLSADGKRLASSLARDSGVGIHTVMHIWEVESGEQLLTIQVSPILVALEIAFRPDGAEIAAARRANSTVYFWDTQTGTALGRLEGEAVEYSPRGDVVATTRGRSVWIWDAETKGLVRVLQVSGEEVSPPIAFSPDGSLLAVGVNSLTIWETADWTEVTALPISGGSLQFLRFSPSGRYLAAINGQSEAAGAGYSDAYTATIWAVAD